jgi:hypothetical protein
VQIPIPYGIYVGNLLFMKVVVVISVRRFGPPGLAASASGKVRAWAGRRFQRL